MLMNQQKQNYENGYIAKVDLHIQCDPQENPNGILQRLEINLKIPKESKQARIVKMTLSRETNAVGITVFYFKLHLKAITEIAFLTQNRQID